MPTPFYHLSVAEELLAEPALPGKIRSLLQEYRPYFLLGNTAPDVQTISGQHRTTTHFFEVPVLPGARLPWENLWAEFPALGRIGIQSREQAAFWTGYVSHLLADWRWVLELYQPAFGPQNDRGPQRVRLFLHDVLRAYLDRQILSGPVQALSGDLRAAKPENWLPFTPTKALLTWRDWLADQLEPGAKKDTVDVFASRGGINPLAFHQLLDNEEELNNQVISRLPRARLEAYRKNLVEENLDLICEYLGNV